MCHSRPALGHTPPLKDFVKATQTGNVIPVYREILADDETPVSAYRKLGRGEYSFLLESVVGGEKWASYSFIGVAPRAVLTCKNGQADVVWYDVDGTGKDRKASWDAPVPTEALATVMGEFCPVPVEGLPRFWGGAVGWVGYDVVRSFENLPASTEDKLGVPDLCMVLTDTVVIFDNLRQTLKVVATPYVPRPEKAEAAYNAAVSRIEKVVEKLRAPSPPLSILPPPAPRTQLPGTDAEEKMRFGGGEAPRSSFDRATFESAVGKMKEYILAGDTFQSVISQRFTVDREGVDPFDVYRALRVVNPSPYMFHLEFPAARVTGASPETLVRCDGDLVEVRPIAGTRPRGRSEATDELLATELSCDEKECAEHLMLIDLGRNDVGRVAKTGSVEVTEVMGIERYSHVMHMVSHVRGTLREGLSWHDVLKAAFPAGTLTGAPKIRAMEVIDELEPDRRGIYGGAVGYVSYSGNMDLAIAIRTLLTVGDEIHVQAGAGIVADSDPKMEYEETLNKARGVFRAVQMAKDGKAAPSKE